MKHPLVAVAIYATFAATPPCLRAQQTPSAGTDADARMCSTIRHAALVEAATNDTVFWYRDAFERLCLPPSAPHPLRAALTPEHCDQAESAAVIAVINKTADARYWAYERARCRALADPTCPSFIRFERTDVALASAVADVLGGGANLLYDDHAHILGVMVEPFPAQCQGTIDYTAAHAAEWLIDYPEDRAKGAAQLAAGIRELQQFLEQSAAEESARRAAEHLTDAALEATLAADRRHYELLATLRALIPAPPNPLQQLMDQQRRDAATAALRRIGFELSEINEGLRQLELQRASRPR